MASYTNPLRRKNENISVPSKAAITVENLTLPSPNSSSEDLLACAHELLNPHDLIWNLDSSLKRSLAIHYAPIANRILRLAMSYPLEKRELFSLDDIFRMMNERKFLEPSTEREIVRLYPSMVDKYGLNGDRQ